MPDTDAELLVRMQQGDSAAFETLYARHQRRVFRFALLYGGSEQLAADVTQEAFMQLIDNVRFDPAQGELAGYLLGMTRNLLRRQRRDDDRYQALDDSEDGLAHEALIERRDPALLVSRAQQHGDLRAAILALPALHREVLILCELEEVDYREAAAILGIPLGTVRSRLNRARKALSAALCPANTPRVATLEPGESYELRAV